jgi:hypothetical protein
MRCSYARKKIKILIGNIYRAEDLFLEGEANSSGDVKRWETMNFLTRDLVQIENFEIDEIVPVVARK